MIFVLFFFAPVYALLLLRALRIPFDSIPFPLLVVISLPLWAVCIFPPRFYVLLYFFMKFITSLLTSFFSWFGIPAFVMLLRFSAFFFRGISYLWDPWSVFSALLTFVVILLFLRVSRSLFVYAYCPLAIRFPGFFSLLGFRRDIVLHISVSGGNSTFVLLPTWAKPSFSPAVSILFDGVGVKQLFNGVHCPIYIKIGFSFFPTADSIKVFLIKGLNGTLYPRVVVRAPGRTNLALVLVHFGDPLISNCYIPSEMQEAASFNGVYSILVREDWLNDARKGSTFKL